MKVENDQIHVASLATDKDGQKLEPEAQPLERVLSGTAPLQVGGQTVEGPGIKSSIKQEFSAGAFAATLRNPCAGCKHFDRTAWQKYVKGKQSTHEGRQFLNLVMAELVATQNMDFQEMHTSPMDGEFDSDHALMSLGVCRIMTEIFATSGANPDDAITTVHPLGVCPPELRSPTKPNGEYLAIDKDTDREGSRVFDNVMRMAQGKAP